MISLFRDLNKQSDRKLLSRVVGTSHKTNGPVGQKVFAKFSVKPYYGKRKSPCQGMRKAPFVASRKMISWANRIRHLTPRKLHGS